MPSNVYDWQEHLSEWLEGPCIHCDESSTADEWHHVAMPVARPKYVDGYIEGLAGPGEQHSVDPGAHCVNPKCGYHFTPQDEQEIRANKGSFRCPQCGFEQDVFGWNTPTYQSDNPDAWAELEEGGNLDTSPTRPANPGGRTRSGLSLDQMGHIGEQVVFRMHELPGIGTITAASNQKNFPIDGIVETQQGRLGVEIKANHSQAQERFKIGGKVERAEKIKYCLANGLKPALIGVRLNFYTNLAFVFFREGLTDTWIGNQQMIHVATVDFADLNPFKSPNEQAQALAVDQARLPDQSESPDDDIDAAFGKAASDEGTLFTIPQDYHRLKVVDKKGKYTHDITRCLSCGHAVQKDISHRARFECPTCGADPTRPAPRQAKVVLTTPQVDQIAQDLGFSYAGRTGQGHRMFTHVDQHGTQHSVVVGSGAHGTDAQLIDAQRGRQRMTRCLNGQCNHSPAKTIQHADEPGSPVVRAGQTVKISDREYFIMEIDGGLVLVLDTVTGGEDVLPTAELHTSANDPEPDYVFIYYMSELRIEKAKPGVRHPKMFEDLLNEFGHDPGGHRSEFEVDPTDVAAGEIFEYPDEIRIEHKQLSKPEVRDEADRLIRDWYRDKISVFGETDETEEPDRDPDTGQWVAAD